jgi:hypothetical protein
MSRSQVRILPGPPFKEPIMAKKKGKKKDPKVVVIKDKNGRIKILVDGKPSGAQG